MRKRSITTLQRLGRCWHGSRRIDSAETERENFDLTLVEC
jgi:hypothetical protein